MVNVKKGTLLPSELSGIGAAMLQQTGTLWTRKTATTATTAQSMHTYDPHRQDQLHSQERSIVMASLTQQSLHREMAMAMIFNIKFRHHGSVLHDL